MHFLLYIDLKLVPGTHDNILFHLSYLNNTNNIIKKFRDILHEVVTYGISIPY